MIYRYFTRASFRWNKRPGRRPLAGILSVKSNRNILPDLADLHEAFDLLIRGTLSCDHFLTKLFYSLAKNLNPGFSPGQEIQSVDQRKRHSIFFFETFDHGRDRPVSPD